MKAALLISNMVERRVSSAVVDKQEIESRKNRCKPKYEVNVDFAQGNSKLGPQRKSASTLTARCIRQSRIYGS
jgi:hypothetical protein